MKRLLMILLIAALTPCMPGWSAKQTKRERQAEIRRAVDLLNEGIDLAAEQDYERAMNKLIQSRALMESPMALYWLGLCYAERGMLPEAKLTLEDCLTATPDFYEGRRLLTEVEKNIAEGKEHEPVRTALDMGKRKETADQTSQPGGEALAMAGGSSSETGIEPSSDASGSQNLAPGAGLPAGTRRPAQSRQLSRTPRVTSVFDAIPENLTREQDKDYAEPAPRLLPEMTEAELAAALFPEPTLAQRVAMEFQPDKQSPITIDSFASHKYWADHFYSKKMWERAASEYLVALRKNPESAECMLNMADSLAQSGREKKASEWFAQARERFPHQPEPFYESGNFYRRSLKDNKTAAAMYRAAIAIDKNFDKAFNNLGIALLNMKQYDDAAQTYQQGIDVNPQNPKFYRNLGIIYEQHLNQPQKALECYQRYVDLGGENKDEVQGWIDALQARQ
ncbi:tetratricopeptide repeat protein [Candidatus Sumerlaeota bacterium]|nr:tetratricopeptide repeat protein [Candidatus Sumerlaeota bacterium]